MKIIVPASLLLGLISLSACAVGPDYAPPQIPAPPAWLSSTAPGAAEPTAQNWVQNFNDPVLAALIARADAQNIDLKIAEARIAEARAGVANADAVLLPTGNIKGTATREANQMAFPGGNDTPTAQLLHKPFNIFQTGFDASWELDLFGGNRRAAEAATAQMQASEASRDDVRVSLRAEVARAYIALRGAQARLATDQDIIAADEKTLALNEQRFRAGEAPRLDITQAEAMLEQAQQALPAARNDSAQNEYALDVLLGERPGFVHKLIADGRPVPVADIQPVLDTPASVIASRPDIRVAERKLAAATAQQGAALAKFFPDISLSGFFGALNTSPQNLITGGSESWMAGGGILWPILSYNSLSANLDAADAQQQEALAVYQKTVLEALGDVERALTAYTEQQKVAQSVAVELDKNRHARAIAQERYQSGLTSRLDVLDADRLVAAAQNKLTDAQATTAQNLIALYKALGGGLERDVAQ